MCWEQGECRCTLCSRNTPVYASLAEHAQDIICQLLGFLGLPAAQQHPEREQHSLKLAVLVEKVLKDKSGSLGSWPVFASALRERFCIGLLQVHQVLI